VIIDMSKSPGMPKTWNGISWDALARFRGYSEFFALSISGVFMILSEWCAFEALIVLAGMLPSGDPKVALGGMGVVVQISGLVWSIVSSVNFAGSIMISRSLGSGNPSHALSHSHQLFKATFAIEVCMALLVVILRNHIGRLFSSSEDVVLAIAHTLPIFALSLLPDGVNIPIQNILKACGKQHVGALLNLLYWIVVPLGILLGIYYQLLLDGLWISILIVNMLLCIASSLLYNLVVDFDIEAENASSRVDAIQIHDGDTVQIQ